MTNKNVVNKRTESTSVYVNALQEEYSKLCAVRVDLAYKKPYSDDITLDDANKDINRMLNNRRSKPSVFKDNVGYIIKKEYTDAKGVHFHIYFFFDGNKVHKDIYKAEQVCNYWIEDITDGKGTSHNCNRNKYKDNGVGMIDHRDSKKRENLDKGIAYLCKDDEKQDIEPVKSNKNDRAFVRGTMPRKKKKNAGRPRKKQCRDKTRSS